MLALKSAVLCFGAGLFLQTIGFVCPGWKIIRVGKARVNMALWYSVVCVDSEKDSNAEMKSLCDTRSYHYMFKLDGDLMSRAGILTFIAIGSMATSTNLTSGLRSDTSFSVPYGLVIMGFGASLVLMATGILAYILTCPEEFKKSIFSPGDFHLACFSREQQVNQDTSTYQTKFEPTIPIQYTQ